MPNLFHNLLLHASDYVLTADDPVDFFSTLLNDDLDGLVNVTFMAVTTSDEDGHLALGICLSSLRVQNATSPGPSGMQQASTSS